MRRLLPLAPTLLFASACSISSDHEGFSIEIGTGVLGQRHHATETRRLELDLAAGDLLLIEGLQGDVTVKASYPYSIDILGLTEKANALPVQQYAAH